MRGARPKKKVCSGSPKMQYYPKYRSQFGRLPYKPQPTPNPLVAFGGGFMTTAEEDEEFRMTVGNIPKKRSFGIFHDSGEASPGRTESPLEEDR